MSEMAGGQQLYEHTLILRLIQFSVKALPYPTYSATRSSFSYFISVFPHTSTSSTNTMTPRASNSSDVIHPAILGSLYGWLITLTTHISISGLRSCISRLILFFSELLEIPSSTRNNIGVGVPDQPRRPSVQDLTASLHTIYGYLTGLLLTLTGIKYQGSGTNPFNEHPTVMMLFLIAIFVYGVALTITLRRSNHDHSANKLMVGVSHICGGLACELLLLVLVSPIKWLLINVSSLALIVMLVLCYKYLLHLLHAEGTEEQGSQMTRDLEAGPTIPTAA